MNSLNKKLHKKVMKHWNENLANLFENYMAGCELDLGIRIRSNSCAFCEHYAEGGCEGCPIEEKTEEDDCRCSPWYEVLAWMNSLDCRNTYYSDEKTLGKKEYKRLFAEGLKAIMTQIDFLEKLKEEVA